MVIKIFYTIFLALLVALFVGLGIEAFYPTPKYPEYPSVLETVPFEPETTVTAEQRVEREKQRVAEEKWCKEEKAYQKKIGAYNRNVSIIALVGAILTLVISLTFLKKILILSDGLLLGGVFTVCYSIIRGFGSDNERFRFAIVTVGLIIALFLGYIKFIKPAGEKEIDSKTSSAGS